MAPGQGPLACTTRQALKRGLPTASSCQVPSNPRPWNLEPSPCKCRCLRIVSPHYGANGGARVDVVVT